MDVSSYIVAEMSGIVFVLYTVCDVIDIFCDGTRRVIVLSYTVDDVLYIVLVMS